MATLVAMLIGAVVALFAAGIVDAIRRRRNR